MEKITKSDHGSRVSDYCHKVEAKLRDGHPRFTAHQAEKPSGEKLERARLWSGLELQLKRNESGSTGLEIQNERFQLGRPHKLDRSQGRQDLIRRFASSRTSVATTTQAQDQVVSIRSVTYPGSHLHEQHEKRKHGAEKILEVVEK